MGFSRPGLTSGGLKLGGFQAPGGSPGDPMEPRDSRGERKLSFSFFFKDSVAWGRLENQKTFIFLCFFKVLVGSRREGEEKDEKKIIVSATA